MIGSTRMLAAGLVGYAAALFLAREYAEQLLIATWSALVVAGTAVSGAIGGWSSAVVEFVTDPDRMIELALDVSSTVAVVVFAAAAWWVLSPVVRAWTQPERDRGAGAEVVAMSDRGPTAGPKQRAA